MSSRVIRWVLRAGCAALIFCGAVLAAAGGERVLAKTAVFQEATGYPAQQPTIVQDDSVYPVVTNTPAPGGRPALATATPFQVISLTPTVALSGTGSPDLYATENAQIGDSISTPQPGGTPAPSITPANTATPILSATPTSALMAAESTRTGGFQVNWGYFMAGFVIPVLAGCGVVLYLLDRRPELFSQRQKL